MSPFSFSLSHTLTVFLSIFRTAPPAEALSFLCFTLSGTHTQWLKKGSQFQPCSQGRMAFVFLLFFFCQFQRVSHALVTAQGNGMLTLEHFSLNGKLNLKTLWNQAHK